MPVNAEETLNDVKLHDVVRAEIKRLTTERVYEKDKDGLPENMFQTISASKAGVSYEVAESVRVDNLYHFKLL